MEIWVSKYALTKGIQRYDAENIGGPTGMVKVIIPGIVKTEYYLHHEGKEWHRTREDAVKRAIEMRENKIESHRKVIKKLSNMNFDE
jgi:hypothetical protein